MCNATHDTCGHCAKAHPTRECSTKDIKDARCGCKKAGHFAWMTKGCEAHRAFREKQKGTEDKLRAATLAVQRTQTPTPQELASQDGFTLVENPAKKRKAGPGRPVGTTNAARALGQMKFQFQTPSISRQPSQEGVTDVNPKC